MTNETIASQLAHRTIRAYKDQPLTNAEVETLMDVARHTATSSFMQSCTVLHITDPTVREAIGAASGQPYVGGTKGDLFIFVADLYRNSRIRAEQGWETELVLSGHSTGGLIASLWADRHPGALRALILNSAWLSLQGSELVRTVGDPVLRTLALRDPRMSILDGWVDPARVFSITDGWVPERDGELPDPAWADDPYVTGWDINPAWSIKPSAPVRVGWLQAVMEGHNRVAQGLDIRCPVLSMGAASTRLGVTWTPESRSADTIIDADATARRAVMLGKLVTIARFPGGVHDLTLSEPPVREQVFSAMRRWMSAYVLR